METEKQIEQKNTIRNVVIGCIVIVALVLLDGMGSGQEKKENPEIESSEIESSAIESYSFVKFDDKTAYGAVFLTTVEEVLEALNKTQVFKNDITLEDMMITKMTDGTNMTRYAYYENNYDAMELYVDNQTGYVVYGGWIADTNYYDVSDANEMTDVYAKAAIVMSSVTGDYSDSLSSSHYISWMTETIENPIEQDGLYMPADYDNGVVLTILFSEDNALFVSTRSMDETAFGNWLSSSK